MEILTLYVGQGALAVIRHGTEGVIIDARIPDCEEISAASVEAKLDLMLAGRDVSGLILTSFDCDHADERGVDTILTTFEPRWIMYPKYYKESDTTTSVFEVISRHEARRARGPRPLQRVSVRVDRLDQRTLTNLSAQFDYELFSPHIEDMDCSNNCSIVLRISGRGPGGFSYLVTGDTENGRWERINALYGGALRSDVLAAPHHGAKNAINGETLLLIDPNTVLISAGVGNQYGHPDPQAVAAYQKVAKQVFATNVEGGVSLFTKQSGDDWITQLVS